MEKAKDILLLDTREHAIRNIFHTEFEETYVIMDTRLAEGDVIYINSETKQEICIERKTIKDFCQSMVTKHLKDQAIRMKEKYPHSYIILYGSFTEIKNDIHNYWISEALFMKWQVELLLDYKVPVFIVYDFLEYCEMVRQIIKTVNLDTEYLEPPIVKRSSKYEALNIITGLNGIGNETGELLLEKFKTIKNICQASADDLKQVKGIGDVTARKIITSLGGKIDETV